MGAPRCAAPWCPIGRFDAPSAPLEAVADAARQVADGRLDVVVPVDRADEIGEMARAVLVFKEAAIEKLRLEAETSEARAAGSSFAWKNPLFLV